jgi:hypothetical protein
VHSANRTRQLIGQRRAKHVDKEHVGAAQLTEGLRRTEADDWSDRRLQQCLAYANEVYGLQSLLDGVRDRRQAPQVGTGLVMRIVFLLGLLRIRSMNALEPRLSEPFLQRALGLKPSGRALCSVDTVAYALQRADVPSAREALVSLVRKAERKKVFREGWHGTLRFVAIDGWEPFCSRNRHCSACLTRQVTVGPKDKPRKVTEYYHRFAVALLIDERLEVVLDFEPVLSADVRKERGQKNVPGHEGELTAGKRLVQRLRTTYGRWLDVLVTDALYANGPFLTIAKQCGYGVIVVLKKETDEPLKEALALWRTQPPERVVRDVDKNERIELWDCPQLHTLSSYDGPVRVVRALIHKENAEPSTWCFGVTGRATRLGAERVVRIGRGRWHLENTGFWQWTKYWCFGHVFTHGKDAIPALFYLFFLAFNILQLFVYRKLRGYGRDRGSDTTHTFRRLADEMLDDLARLKVPIVWNTS